MTEYVDMKIVNSESVHDNVMEWAKTPRKNNVFFDTVLYYFGGLIAVVLICYISVSFLPIVYLAVGFVLSHKIMRQMEFHPIYDTLGNISSAKLWSFLLWPLAYLMLMSRLFITKIL